MNSSQRIPIRVGEAYQRIVSFCYSVRGGRFSGGNEHHVFLLNNGHADPDIEKDNRYWQSLSKKVGKTFIAVGASRSPNTCQVRFYFAGQEVERCGSGAIALARLIHDSDYGYTTAEPFSFELKNDSWKIVVKNADEFGFSGIPLPLVVCSNPIRWTEMVSEQPKSVYLLGDENDYLVFEYASANTVKHLDVYHHRIVGLTMRALIVTAPGNEPDEYVMRYFAPQYGQLEDTATGSANLHVSQLWFDRTGLRRLRSKQLSQRGGEFSLEMERTSKQPPASSMIWVYGKTFVTA